MRVRPCSVRRDRPTGSARISGLTFLGVASHATCHSFQCRRALCESIDSRFESPAHKRGHTFLAQRRRRRTPRRLGDVAAWCAWRWWWWWWWLVVWIRFSEVDKPSSRGRSRLDVWMHSTHTFTNSRAPHKNPKHTFANEQFICECASVACVWLNSSHFSTQPHAPPSASPEWYLNENNICEARRARHTKILKIIHVYTERTRMLHPSHGAPL